MMIEEEEMDADESPLPVDIWVSSMEFLPYQDILQCCAINRFFLRRVIPLIRNLEMFDPHELHVAPLGRFSGVTDVNINCLVRVDEEGEGHILCKDTAARLIHFLSRFPNLERAWAGGVDSVNYTWNYHFTYNVNECQTDGHEGVFRALIRSLCAAYGVGVLKSTQSVDGLICSGFDEDEQAMFICAPEVASGGAPCELCRDICNSLPLEWAMKLRQKRENVQARDRDWFNTRGSVCLTTRDRVSIMERRRGGAHFLASPSAISCCISKRDSRDALDFRINKKGRPSKKGKYHAIAIDVSFEILEELRMVLEYGFNPRHVRYEDIVQDYWRNLGGELPPKGSCYMTRRTHNAFKNLGFSINETDFFLVDSDDCTGWQEGLAEHPGTNGWTFIVPGAWNSS